MEKDVGLSNAACVGDRQVCSTLFCGFPCLALHVWRLPRLEQNTGCGFWMLFWKGAVTYLGSVPESFASR